MKNLILLATMAFSVTAFSASVRKEYDPQQEEKCYSEAKDLGCVKKNDQEDRACLEKKKAKLSKTCVSLHEQKKSN